MKWLYAFINDWFYNHFLLIFIYCRDTGIFIDQIRSFFVTWVPSYVPTLKSRRTPFESSAIITSKKKEKHYRRDRRKDNNSHPVVAKDVL